MKLNSDPTYEAWKLSAKLFISLRSGIPILPTRHGNNTLYLKSIRQAEYSDPTYEAWKLDFLRRKLLLKRIPILPTRHGNRAVKYQGDHNEVIPILPTRHGNSGIVLRYR